MISFQHFSLIRIALTAYHPAKINTTTTNQYIASALCRLPCKRGLGFAHRDHGQQPNGHYTHVWQKGDSMINLSNNCWRTRTQTSTRHLERLKWTAIILHRWGKKRCKNTNYMEVVWISPKNNMPSKYAYQWVPTKKENTTNVFYHMRMRWRAVPLFKSLRRALQFKLDCSLK